jgi:hypothetical protein
MSCAVSVLWGGSARQLCVHGLKNRLTANGQRIVNV